MNHGGERGLHTMSSVTAVEAACERTVKQQLELQEESLHEKDPPTTPLSISTILGC